MFGGLFQFDQGGRLESPETEVALLKALHKVLLCQDFRNSWSVVHMGLMNEPIFELLVPKEVHDD